MTNKHMNSGILEVALTSAEMENVLGIINSKGIIVMNLTKVSDLTCHFTIRNNDYFSLEAICRKRGATLNIRKKAGIYWTIRALLYRPVLIIGFAMVLFLTLYLPTRVLFVSVKGNETIPSRKIIDAAENCGIHFGVSRRKVRSEAMKNALLSALPQLQWAGINTEGCTAIISVREGVRSEEDTDHGLVSSIVAARDGYILSGTVLQGNGLFCPGQTVTEGQVLISGYTDCGICIQATRAQGEVIAQTNRQLKTVTLAEYTEKRKLQETKRKYSLIFRKKRINLWKDSGISDGSYGRMYKEYYVTLPGDFRLPFSLCVEVFTAFEPEAKRLPAQEAKLRLSAFAQTYLTDRMLAGTIVDKTEVLSEAKDVYILDGRYTCVEMIGREVTERIGETNGKTN